MSITKVVKRTTTVLLAVVLSTAGVRAQLGLSESEFREQWGTPISRGESTPGIVSLIFEHDEMTIEAACLDGAVRRIVYKKPDLSGAEVSALLQRNKADREWDVWTPPGTGAPAGAANAWMRSDEMAMATLGEGQLAIVGAEWNLRDRQRPKPQPKPAEVTNAPPAIPEPPKAVAKGPASEVAGFWAAAAEDGRMLALHILPGGPTTWIVYGEYEKKEFALATTEGSRGDLPTFALVAQEGERALGSMRLAGGNTLRFSPESGAEPSESLAPMCARKTVVFTRRPGLPKWRPKPKKDMPSVGDTREQVVELLGKPLGAFKSDKSEALQYDWGQVVIRDGKVVAIE